jgi:threonine aldolase
MAAGYAEELSVESIDLRSDFLTRPTAAMLSAAAAAESSRHFGLREDPWQRRLEARVAELVGMEDALVFPTCTMANTTALMLGAPPGSRVVTQDEAHVLISEAGAGAALGGLVMTSVGVPGAVPPLAAWERALGDRGDTQRPAVRLCVLENTHNRSGGVPIQRDDVAAVIALARARRIGLHLDGARLFDAAYALGTPAATLAAGFDTVSVSFNKGFGAPIAAALAGSTALIEAALIVRQRLGGGIRPTGPAAAATLAGLEDFSHFAEVHGLARRLAAGLSAQAGLAVEEARLRTNMVIVRSQAPDDALGLCTRLAARGLLALPFDKQRIRFVVYRGITPGHVERALAIASDVLSAA